MSFFSSQKGQSLSFNFIVLAALALIVMAVIIMIFVSKSSDSGEAFSSCELAAGICVSGDSCFGKTSVGALPQKASGKCSTVDDKGNSITQTCCLRDTSFNKPEAKPTNEPHQAVKE